MRVPEAQRHSVSRRLGAVLLRAPYGSAAATTVALLLVLSAFTTTLNRESTRPWLDWVVLALAAYTVLASLILVPKIVLPRARPPQSNERVALMRWSFALAAFPFGLVAWELGGARLGAGCRDVGERRPAGAHGKNASSQPS